MVNVPATQPVAFEAPAPPPPPKPAPVVIPAPGKIVRLTPARTRKFNTDIPVAAKLKTVTTPGLATVVFEKPAPPPPVVVVTPKPVTEKITRLKPAKLSQANVVFVIEERSYMLRRPPELAPLKFEIPKTPVAKAGNVPVDVTPPGKKMDYNIESVEAKQTTVEIYIVNSKGQLVGTSPQVALIDPVSKKLVKQFYRTVDASGNPDPQPDIPVGTYNITFPAKQNLVIPNVHVEANKRNKITVRVKNVTLKFGYLGDPSRPVKEFGARVIERDKAKGRVQGQLCTAEFEYEPGNYHVRINTFPEEVRNVDLDLDEVYKMEILQPGFVKFTSDAKQVVTLWKTDGDKFVAFHQLDLNDPGNQHKQIQPGKYQVHYHKGPAGPSASEKVKVFIIKSNETTEVILD